MLQTIQPLRRMPQVMMEFCDPKEFQIIVAIDEERYIIKTLEELLPLGFGPGNLKEKQ